MMIKQQLFSIISIVLAFVSLVQAGSPPTVASLGEKLYFDTNLSDPPGQSCASCHLPGAGFADPDRELPVSRGVHPDRFGDRNTPTAAYALYSPAFHFDEKEGHYVGGQFWDGRAATLEEQAKGPFLNPVEMANADPGAVVQRVRHAPYAGEFDVLFGKGSLKEVDKAYEFIATAIATFERTEQFHSFSSKFDYYLAGKAKLTEQERRGMLLFDAPDKGNCAACHPSSVGDNGQPPLFTDFTYDNLGVPRNEASPFYTQSASFNPKGSMAIDIEPLGLKLAD